MLVKCDGINRGAKSRKIDTLSIMYMAKVTLVLSVDIVLLRTLMNSTIYISTIGIHDLYLDMIVNLQLGCVIICCPSTDGSLLLEGGHLRVHHLAQVAHIYHPRVMNAVLYTLLHPDAKLGAFLS